MKRKDSLKRSLELFFLPFLILLLLVNLTIADNSEVKNETCLECHDGKSETLSLTPHQLQNNKTEVNCISCHAGGEVHVEDPSVDNIVNPKQVSGLEALNACKSCHTPHTELDNLGLDVHQSQGLNCASCHTIHGGKKSLLVDDNALYCMTCHSDMNLSFSKRSNHPVKQGNMTCLSCHSFSKKTGDDFMYDSKRVCQSCHPDQSGPFIFEHDAANAYMVGGTGCVECHDPHGSENDFLLKQPVNSTCKSCHFVPAHETAHPNRNYQELNCVTCHTDHHGSFITNKLLDPDLNTRFADNCYQSGCHSISN